LKAALSCALLAACLSFGPGASAESAATLIVLIADEPADPVVARLSRDLQGLGFGVVVLSATPENTGDANAPQRTTRSLGGLAGVRVLPGGRGSALWVLEPSTNRSVTRELTGAADANTDPNEVALGTLELLRASMLELHPPPPEPKRQVAPPAPPAPPPPPVEAPVRVSLSGAFAAELGLRSVSASTATMWSVWLRLGGCFGVRGFTALPLSSEHTRVAEGEVEVRPTLVGLGLSCSSERSGWLTPRVGLGVVGARIETRGLANVPSLNRQAAVWLGGGFGLLGIGARVTRDVRLNLDATGVVLPTPASILVQQREVGTWGAPGALLSLGLEVSTSL
jgi:hypothetical protein